MLMQITKIATPNFMLWDDLQAIKVEMQKMILDASLFKTQHYKVCIKGKEEQSRERSRSLPLYLVVVDIKKGAFGSPLITVANFTFTVFANGPGDLGSIPGRVIPKTLKMELDTTLLNTQHYKVRFKGKVEQSWEWSSALPYTLV